MKFIMVKRNNTKDYSTKEITNFNENWIVVKDLTEIIEPVETFIH